MNESPNNATTDIQQPTQQKSELADLPVTDEQTQQAKGGSDALSYNFGGMEGADGTALFSLHRRQRLI